MENVRLEFTDEALRAVVRIAQKRKTGARGLRAVIEDAMLNIMYDLPSRKDVEACIDHRGGDHPGRGARGQLPGATAEEERGLTGPGVAPGRPFRAARTASPVPRFEPGGGSA